MTTISRERMVAAIKSIKPHRSNGPNWEFGYNTAITQVLAVIEALPAEGGVCGTCEGTGTVLYLHERPGGPPGNSWGPCPACSVIAEPTVPTRGGVPNKRDGLRDSTPGNQSGAAPLPAPVDANPFLGDAADNKRRRDAEADMREGGAALREAMAAPAWSGVEELAEAMCDEHSGELGDYANLKPEYRSRWRTAARVALSRPAPVAFDVEAAARAAHERWAMHTGSSLTWEGLSLAARDEWAADAKAILDAGTKR